MGVDRRSRCEAIVHRWEGPVYGLALRMLGNAADAEDATQDVFLQVFRQLHRYDPARPLSPWLFRVATNVLRNAARTAATRTRHERAVPARGAGEEDSVERAEQEARVQTHVARLPAREREVLVLHFYSGLSKAEIAESLSVPRTTVQSRLASALSRLRGELAAAGHAALCPVVAEVMRATPEPAVPASLHAALSGLAAAVKGGGAAAGLGGFIMRKKIAIAVTLVACAGGGFLAGEARRGRAAARAEARVDEPAAVRVLEARNAALEQRVRELEASHANAAAASPVEDVGAGPASAAGSSEGIDWSRFARAFADGVDAAARARREGREREPTAEEEQATLSIYSTFLDASRQALQLSSEPFFDPRVLPGLMAAIYGPSLGLDRETERAVRELARGALERNAGDLDLASALPVERLRARIRVIADLDLEMQARTPPGSEERLRAVQETAHELLDGSRQVISIGIRPGVDRGPAIDTIVEWWSRRYGLTDVQAAGARELAAEYLRAAERVLVEAGAYPPGAEIDRATQVRIDIRMLSAQTAIERQLFASVPDEVRRRMLDSRMPCMFRIRFGEGVSNTSWSRGF